MIDTKQKESKIKVLALFGPSGAGKDALLNYLYRQSFNGFIEHPLDKIIPCTTRPKRDYEIEGQDYYFLDLDTFVRKDINREMFAVASFNNWLYGFPLDGFNEKEINMGVFSIEGIESLLQNKQLDILPIYVYCDSETRLRRSLDREDKPDCHEICRRYLADEVDFMPKNIHFNYISLNNSASLETTFASFLHNQTITEWLNNKNN